MKNKEIANRVLANTQYFYDLDMTYPFKNLSPLEEMEDAESGSYDVLPSKTLRGRPYGKLPLMLHPEYSGDFLEKMKEEVMNKDAANPENIYDYSMPSELLKHQETAIPDDRTDDFYEYTKLDEFGGYKTLKDYYDRGWDPWDAPEMSEDKVLRMWDNVRARKIARSFVDNFLINAFGVNLELDTKNIRTAMLLSDLTRSRMKGKGGYKDVGKANNVVLTRAEPKQGRWTFSTGDSGERYTTIFQFIRQGTVTNPNKLHVRVTCTCPSWLYYGAQYNAFMKDYLYGKIRPKLVRPRIKDPDGRFLCCKHVMACIDFVSRYKIQITKEYRRPPEEPEIQVTEIPVKRIPSDFQKFVDTPEMRKIDRNWNDWSVKKRKDFVNRLDDPDAVMYLSYRFPDTASAYSHERLVQMSKMTDKPETQSRALELLGKSKAFRIPEELKGVEHNPNIVEAEKSWDTWDDRQRKRFINDMENSDELEYIAHRFPESSTDLIARRLKDLITKAETPEKKAMYQEVAEGLV